MEIKTKIYSETIVKGFSWGCSLEVPKILQCFKFVSEFKDDQFRHKPCNMLLQ
jgi:hypothetical protein